MTMTGIFDLSALEVDQPLIMIEKALTKQNKWHYLLLY